MNTRMLAGSVRLLGSGAVLPGEALDTDTLITRVEQQFGIAIRRQAERIASRLGVQRRHFSRDFMALHEVPRAGESNPELCATALRQALAAAHLSAGDLGYLIGHTTTPHTHLPPNASWVADHIAFDGPYLELRQACCGFANALQIAAAFLAGPDPRPIAIVGSETGSVFLDPRACQEQHDQLVNLLQMGDGAGAVILAPAAGAAAPANPEEPPASSLTHLFYGTLGPGRAPGIQLIGGSSSRPTLEGVSAFQHDFSAVRDTGGTLFEAGIAAFASVGVSPHDVDFILTHQAAALIPRLMAPRIGVPEDRFYVDCDRVGNLGSASIWVALHRLRTSGRLLPGQTVMVLGAEASKYFFGGFLYRHGST